jgi:tetratricopeptide (TPR) repeat protein
MCRFATRLPQKTLLIAIALAAGCSHYAQHVELAREHFYSGRLEMAAAAFDEAIPKSQGSGDVINLEKSLVLLADGRPAEAESLLREVRDRFDHLELSSPTEKAVSMFTDDTRIAYAGEDYEKVLIRAMLALTNLMHDGGDAEAYSLQVVDKQQQIIQAAAIESEENPKAAYKQVAVGPYLRGILREETHTNYDDAARSFETVVSWQPEFAPGKHDLARAAHGRHSERGNGVVYVFALVGQGPHKIEVAEVPSSVALLVADRIISAVGDQTLPPTIAPIKVPKVVASHNVIGSVGIDVDGKPAARTETITDVTAMAVSQGEAIHDQIVGRAVARRVLKKASIYGVKEFTGVEKHTLAGLGFDALGVVWEATENADTRSWSLLPDKIQVLRLELPAGEHQLSLTPLGHNGRPYGQKASQAVTVADGRNTYVLASFPGQRLVGKVLVSRP